MVYVVFIDAYDFKMIDSIWSTFSDAAERIKNMADHNKADGMPVILQWTLNSDENEEVEVKYFE